jgi:nucleotide-binding universal stress UspA family protein
MFNPPCQGIGIIKQGILLLRMTIAKGKQRVNGKVDWMVQSSLTHWNNGLFLEIFVSGCYAFYMYRKVLAAVNEHLNSEVSARYALHLAKKENARIYFCSIAENSLSDKGFRIAEEAVKRLSDRAQELGLKPDCILETGNPVEQIKKIVAAEGIDIVFAATRREDVKQRFYARTTARQLSLTLPCSVALVRVVHMGRAYPKTILVPLKARIDHIAERATFTALMAAAFGSSISLFHSTKPMLKFFHGEIHLTPLEWEEKTPKDVLRFIEQLNRYEVSLEKKLVPGIAGKNITTEAAVKRHDLIIMGASERSLLSSFMRGSPVEQVLRDTPCNLIILKPGHENP